MLSEGSAAQLVGKRRVSHIDLLEKKDSSRFEHACDLGEEVKAGVVEEAGRPGSESAMHTVVREAHVSLRSHGKEALDQTDLTLTG